MKNKIRVLIADDHPVVRQGLRAMLETKPDLEVVGEARDGVEALQLAKVLNPEVILMDLVMPKKSGLEAITEICKENPHVHVLVLTSFPDDNRISAALKAGASGYLLKDSSPEDLLQAIRDIHQGKASFTPEIANRLLSEIRHPVESALDDITLTPREIDILRLAAQGRTNAQIAAKLIISEGTVRYHISHILGKLNLANRTQAVLYALQRGWAKLDSSLASLEE